MSSINNGSIDIDMDYCWAEAGVFLEVGEVGVEVKALAQAISWELVTLTKEDVDCFLCGYEEPCVGQEEKMTATNVATAWRGYHCCVLI